jgi:TRAP-type C4-dicarboxylate transport system permease small subunit
MASKGTVAVLKDWRRKFFSAVEAVLFLLVLALLVLIALQVFTRYVLQASLPWTEEVARMVLVWAVMLGAAVAMERNEHYAVTVFSARFRGATRIGVLIATNLIGLLFLLALVRYGAEYMSANMKTVYVSTQVSRGWVYLAMPVGATIMGLSLLLHSIEAWIDRHEAAAPAVVLHAPDV